MPKLINRKTLYLITLLLVNVAFFGFVSPLEGSSLLLFVGFAILAVDFYLLVRFIISIVSQLSGHKWRNPRLFAMAVTSVFIIILSLQSIGQLSLRDVVAILIIGGIFLIYSSYYRKKH